MCVTPCRDLDSQLTLHPEENDSKRPDLAKTLAKRLRVLCEIPCHLQRQGFARACNAEPPESCLGELVAACTGATPVFEAAA